METTIAIVRWVIGGAAVAFGCYVIAVQLGAVIAWCLARLWHRPYNIRSFGILLGPLLVLIGAWVLPTNLLHRFVWLAWVLDPGTYLLILGLPNIMRALIWKQ